MKLRKITALAALAAIAFASLALPVRAQCVTSSELSPDRRITIRIAAPNTQAVGIRAGDIPGGIEFTT
jgi:hypothetical protein